LQNLRWAFLLSEDVQRHVLDRRSAEDGFLIIGKNSALFFQAALSQAPQSDEIQGLDKKPALSLPEIIFLM
jgi:hypothetical protein